MKKKFTLSLLCASMVVLTGCKDEEVIFKTSPEVENQLQQYKVQNDALTRANTQLLAINTQLTSTNNTLKTEIEDLKNNPIVKPYDFASQCKMEGIEFDYVNPNSPTTSTQSLSINMTATTEDCTSCHNAQINPGPHPEFGNCANCHDGHNGNGTLPPSGGPTDPTFNQPEFAAGAIDGKTGASGASFYTPGSYLNAEWLKKQLDAQFNIYRWKEVTTGGVTKLASACGLDNRQHMMDMFPNDGKAYEIEHKYNAIGAKLVATVNKFEEEGVKVQTPNIATFGYGLKEIDGSYFVTMNIMKTNTCYNAIMNGEARLSYYEYDPAALEKTGLEVPSRNRGARIITKTDYKQTSLIDLNRQPLPGFGTGEEFTPTDVNWDSVGSCSLYLKVENIIPLG
uniref:Putative diheme cytochrome c n=1 Tax=Shewanella putrefaciens (strain 200) TaxID=399804 RepID=E6XHA3_SHEP2